MIAICDCNAFYCACHMLFEPTLWNKPVVVLSNNRGVIVSLNKRAKAIGLQRGMTEFENERIFKQHNVYAFESNYQLYDDMSDRVMITLADLVNNLQIESIDEAFLDLKGYERYGYNEYGLLIAQTVKKDTGIPVSLGIAPTKTLAKLANRFAKKYPRFNGVFVIDSELKRKECLIRTSIADVWGIGDKLGEKLNAVGIFTAWDFVTKLTRKQARYLHNVVLESTWCELQGISCFPIETEKPDKKSITSSRSFAQMVADKESLKQAISTHAAICAANLRKQSSYAVKMRVYLRTNRFKEDLPQYNPCREFTMELPSNATATLAKCAVSAVDDMFIPGFQFKSAGVEVVQLTRVIQTDLYTPIDRELKLARISRVEDHYAHGFNRHLLSLAVMGFGDREKIDLKQQTPLKCYTTCFNDLIRINCY